MAAKCGHSECQSLLHGHVLRQQTNTATWPSYFSAFSILFCENIIVCCWRYNIYLNVLHFKIMLYQWLLTYHQKMLVGTRDSWTWLINHELTYWARETHSSVSKHRHCWFRLTSRLQLSTLFTCVHDYPLQRQKSEEFSLSTTIFLVS